MTFKCYVIKEGTPQKTWRWSPNVFVFHLTLILCFSYSPVCCSKKLPYIFIVNKSVWHSRVWKNMSRRVQHRCSREEESQLLRAACCYAVSFCRISVYAHKNWEWSKDWSFIVKLQAHINSLTVTLWRRNGKPSACFCGQMIPFMWKLCQADEPRRWLTTEYLFVSTQHFCLGSVCLCLLGRAVPWHVLFL